MGKRVCVNSIEAVINDGRKEGLSYPAATAWYVSTARASSIPYSFNVSTKRYQSNECSTPILRSSYTTCPSTQPDAKRSVYHWDATNQQNCCTIRRNTSKFRKGICPDSLQ